MAATAETSSRPAAGIVCGLGPGRRPECRDRDRSGLGPKPVVRQADRNEPTFPQCLALGPREQAPALAGEQLTADTCHAGRRGKDDDTSKKYKNKHSTKYDMNIKSEKNYKNYHLYKLH